MANKLKPEETESGIQSAICAYLEAKQHCFWRSNNIPVFQRDGKGGIIIRAMPKYTPKGLPDITLIKKGIYYGLEVKRKNMGLSPDQEEIKEWIEQHGGKYFLVRSIDDIGKIGL